MSGDGAGEAMGRRAFVKTAAGATAAAGAVGSAAGQDGDEVTVELDDFFFEPGTDSPLQIEPGTTVTFVWITDTHNIVVDSQPDDADWEGQEEIENSGFEYEFTFEVEGTYEFHCEPHLQQGMEGTIEVGEGGGGGGEPEFAPAIPDAARSLAIATVLAMASILAFAYVFLKYGGEGPPEE
ncbi:MAG: plastocyanin/azurin family copper-binding protein [Halobacteriota archaeon]